MINMGVILGFRVEDKEAELLREVSKARGEDLSGFIRRAVFKELAELGYLPDERKKALGWDLSQTIKAVDEANEKIKQIGENVEKAMKQFQENIERASKILNMEMR